MTSGGGAGRPLLYFDHALIAVPDLDASVRAFEQRYGVTAYLGGRHPAVGTANAIVPVGGRQYLELIAVVDEEEASRSARSSSFSAAVRRGETFAAWALRTDDVDAARSALGIDAEGMPGSRDKPDGTRLEWTMLEVHPPDTGSGVPFLINWRSAAHPGAEGDGRVHRVVVEDGRDGLLRDFFDRVSIDVAVDVRKGDRPRLLEVELTLNGRNLTIS